jgi:hypothetical protein
VDVTGSNTGFLHVRCSISTNFTSLPVNWHIFSNSGSVEPMSTKNLFKFSQSMVKVRGQNSGIKLKYFDHRI